MSLKYGFYNSQNGDRKYDAKDMSSLFDGLIADGIFATVGNQMLVTASGGMNVAVGTGRAWFNSTWTLNDTPYGLVIPDADLVLDRIDLVVLEVNTEDSSRVNSLKVIKGLESATPEEPALTETEYIHQYPLCAVLVGAGVTEILQANITNKVGTGTTPFVVGIIDTVDISALLAQWEDDFDNQFNAWFDAIKGSLGDDPATELAAAIMDINIYLQGQITFANFTLPTAGYVDVGTGGVRESVAIPIATMPILEGDKYEIDISDATSLDGDKAKAVSAANIIKFVRYSDTEIKVRLFKDASLVSGIEFVISRIRGDGGAV